MNLYYIWLLLPPTIVSDRMIGKQGLLSILQFVAVTLPALVVVMEIVVSRSVGDSIEIYSVNIDEYRLLEYSLALIIIGTGLILYRLLDFMTNPLVISGVFLIFGSIPLSLVTLWILSIRQDHTETEEGSISETAQENIRGTFNRVVSLTPIIGIPGIVIWLTEGLITNYLSVGVFYNGWFLSSYQFVAIGFVACVIKGVVTVNSKFSDLDRSTGRQFGNSISMILLLLIVHLVFTVPIYLLSFSVVYIADMFIPTSQSFWVYNVGFLWATIVFYGIIVFDFDPDFLESDEQ